MRSKSFGRKLPLDGMRWLLSGLLLVGVASNASPPPKWKAQIRITSHGVAHILASDMGSAGFGAGFAFAQTGICDIAERWITVNGQRSKYFGPDGHVPTFGDWDKNAPNNLESDFFWQWINDTDVVRRELKAPSPRSPGADVRAMIRGYVAGYNQYLAKTGVANIPDRRCRGAAWVRPITERDVYLRALHWSMFATSVNLIRQYVAAAPPAEKSASLSAPNVDVPMGLARAVSMPKQRTGSNMIALGKDATDNGRGMLFANPHWYWNGPERFFESQITIPGKMNVYGVATLGMPVIIIGETEHAAWSHTVSTPTHYTVYELKLVPGAPTSYMLDGAVRSLRKKTVRVQVREADGRIAMRSHVFWSTPYGLLAKDTSLGWTPQTAYAVRDADISLSWMNKTMALNHAQSVTDIQQAGKHYLGIPWVNTIAADSNGGALYADDTPVPHVTDDMLRDCAPPVFGKSEPEPGLFILDGSRSDCDWGSDADSIQAGTFGPSKLPRLVRTDFVTNSNDSYWANNPHQLLEGYPRIMGAERTARTLRTRIGLLKLERRLAGKDGLPGNRFTLEDLHTITMDNRVLSGELWRDSVVATCGQLPPGENVLRACEALAHWDLTEDLDSAGSVLWRRFFQNLTGNEASENTPVELFSVAFDAADPAHTPSGLNVSNGRVQSALKAAIADLQKAGISLDASLRKFQYVTRNGVQIPIPGGPGGPGQYNDIESCGGWMPLEGWPEVCSGSSFVMWTQFTERGPQGRSILTYSQSNDPNSQFYSDQTKLFSEKKTKAILFSEADIAADPGLRTMSVETN